MHVLVGVCFLVQKEWRANMLGFSIYRDVAANFLLLVILVKEERKNDIARQRVMNNDALSPISFSFFRNHQMRQ